jgi:aspartyl-tRNA(Asn)/glutamyl-tRNA(Gln) amidotransferase subunit A
MELCDLTIGALNKKLIKREISAVEIARSCLERIKKTNADINALITVLPEEEVLKQAQECDRRFKEKREQAGALCGIPVVIKDNICTRGVRTTAGSKILEDFVPPYNATVIDRLQESGAVFLGKANLDEFAMGSSTENSYFGVTKNPWDHERVAGGSSGGSAAAVAAGQAVLSLGSDTGGSIRQPASFCGVLGFKPSYGRVSRYGLIAFGSSLDQIGPFSRNVKDCARLLGVIAGYDRRDSTSVKVPVPDYLQKLSEPTKGLRIGLPKEYFGNALAPEVRRVIEEALKYFSGLGIQAEETSLPLIDYVIPTYYIIACSEVSSNLSRFDGVKYGFRAKNYSNLLDMYEKTRSEGFGAEAKRRIILGTYSLSAGYYDEYYNKALKVRTLLRRDFENAFEKFDAIVTPVSPTPAFKIGEKTADPLKMYLSDIFSVTMNLVGIPALSIPCGTTSTGLPVGLQICGRPYREDRIFQIAHAFEKAVSLPRMIPHPGKSKSSM